MAAPPWARLLTTAGGFGRVASATASGAATSGAAI